MLKTVTQYQGVIFHSKYSPVYNVNNIDLMVGTLLLLQMRAAHNKNDNTAGAHHG